VHAAETADRGDGAVSRSDALSVAQYLTFRISDHTDLAVLCLGSSVHFFNPAAQLITMLIGAVPPP
jgi:hypothetical protein